MSKSHCGQLHPPPPNDRRERLTPSLATLLHYYVQYVALRIANCCRRDLLNSSPIVWLGYKEWRSINYFEHARVVLCCKEYEEVSFANCNASDLWLCILTLLLVYSTSINSERTERWSCSHRQSSGM